MNQNSWTKFTLIQHYGCTNIAAEKIQNYTRKVSKQHLNYTKTAASQ